MQPRHTQNTFIPRQTESIKTVFDTRTTIEQENTATSRLTTSQPRISVECDTPSTANHEQPQAKDQLSNQEKRAPFFLEQTVHITAPPPYSFKKILEKRETTRVRIMPMKQSREQEPPKAPENLQNDQNNYFKK